MRPDRVKRLSHVVWLSTVLLVSGCREDRELTRMQADVTEAASDLVQEDARARREVLQMQATLDAERQRLHEQTRQAERRARQAPIIAAAIQQLGGLFLCLLPLLVLLWLLVPRRSESDAAELSEWMIDAFLDEDDAPQPPIALEHRDLNALVEARQSDRQASVAAPPPGPNGGS